MDFEERLQRAVKRGQNRAEEKAREAEAHRMNEDDYKNLHTKYRLELSEKIESSVNLLPQHFPGFSTEPVYGEQGWGFACYRDDLTIEGGSRKNLYSRFEMSVKAYSKYHVLEIASKGTIKNKEAFTRSHFAKLDELDFDAFVELANRWVLDYAEQFAAEQ